MSWVVVLLGSECAEYPDVACPVAAYGPFDHLDMARAAAARVPAMKPHVISLESAAAGSDSDAK